MLDVECVDPQLFRSPPLRTTMQRTFGGQVLAQSLVAAGRTVPAGRFPHSLHGYFLRPGQSSHPILYEVEFTRDGRTFTTRRVIARQSGRVIFHMTASFQQKEDGYEHQDHMPSAPDPAGLPTLHDELTRQSAGPSPDEWDCLDVRYVPSEDASRHAVWLRTSGVMPNDDLLHTAVLAYASDLTLLAAAGAHHGLSMSDPTAFIASIDHAMWFHRQARADEWLLHDQESPSASGGRGLGRGRMFDLAGRLVASAVQEGLIRPMR